MPRDAGQDAGAADASTGDASMDAGAPDAAPDAGTDAGIDAAADAGIGVACAEGAGPRVRWDFESPRPREDSAGRAPALDLSWAPDLPMGDFGMGRAQLDGGRLEASLEAGERVAEESVVKFEVGKAAAAVRGPAPPAAAERGRGDVPAARRHRAQPGRRRVRRRARQRREQ